MSDDGSGLEMTTYGQVLENTGQYISNNNQMDFLGRDRGKRITELRPVGQWFAEMWSPDQQHQCHLETC